MDQTEDTIIGQEALLKFFNKLGVISERKPVGGSFILLGPVGSGKKMLANILASKLLCQNKAGLKPCGKCSACHELQSGVSGNIFRLTLADGKKNIPIEEIRSLIHSLSLSALGRGYKVAIIDQAEKLSHQSANALLKTLEEPAKNTVIILLVSDLSDLPKTIVSRSQIFNLHPVAPEIIYDWLVAQGSKRSQAKILSALSLGWPGVAVKLTDQQALADHLAVAEVFLQALNQNLLDRQAGLDKILSSDLSAEEILTIWQTTVRDLMLFKLAQGAWLRYGNLLSQFESKLNFPAKQVITWHKLIAQAKEYLLANVNQKSVLENVIFNL